MRIVVAGVCASSHALFFRRQDERVLEQPVALQVEAEVSQHWQYGKVCMREHRSTAHALGRRAHPRQQTPALRGLLVSWNVETMITLSGVATR